MEENFLDKTLEELENKYWPPYHPKYVTGLMPRVEALRKKKLRDFTEDDLRVYIIQNFGALKYLLPIALPLLEENPMRDAGCYPGALLSAVLYNGKDTDYWKQYPEHRERVINLFRNKAARLLRTSADGATKRKLFKEFARFCSLISEREFPEMGFPGTKN